MGSITNNKLLFFCLLAVVVMAWPTPSYAYIGPAIAFIGYLFGPFAAVFAVIAMVLYLPVKKLVKKIKAKDQNIKSETEKKSIGVSGEEN